jgi:uncharacterized Fe-S cluster-containing radical SAM superfamily protein
MEEEYPRYLTPYSKVYAPLWLGKKTEEIVCRGDKRKYTAFYATGVYGGIATGYTVGCCLRCYYCWVDWSRDFPERYGKFYSPKEAFEQLQETAKKYGVKKARISGAEPTLGKAHLLGLLEFIESSHFSLFILETNGILFGSDKDYVKKISQFKKVHVRVCLKAGLPKGFRERTGAAEEAFELPYNAIKNLLEYNANFHVAAMTDPRIMSKIEREALISKLQSIHPSLSKYIEEERIDPYKTTLARLKLANVAIFLKETC